MSSTSKSKNTSHPVDKYTILEKLSALLDTHTHSNQHGHAPNKQQLLHTLSTLLHNNHNHHVNESQLQPHTRYLKIHVQQGKAFVDEIQSDTNDTNHPHAAVYQLTLQLGSTLCTSQYIPTSVEPNFNFTCFLPLQPLQQPTTTKHQLLSLPECLQLTYFPLHVILTRTATSTTPATCCATTVLLTTQLIEWRYVLVHGKYLCMVELSDAQQGSLNSHTIGLLPLELEILPLKYPPTNSNTTAPPTVYPIFLESSTITQHLHNEHHTYTNTIEKFFSYVQAYYKEYLNVRPIVHEKRLIRLFINSEYQVHHGTSSSANHHASGDSNHTHATHHYALTTSLHSKFVTTFIQPLYTYRSCLPTVLHIQRFIKLLPLKHELLIGGIANGVLYDSSTVFQRGTADRDNKSILLCNLLLGYGMDAYIVSGSDAHYQPSLYVIVRVTGHHVIIYDPISGKKYDVYHQSHSNHTSHIEENKDIEIPYKHVYSVFNHVAYYSNIQMNDTVTTVLYDLENEKLWKPMSRRAIALLPKPTPVLVQPISKYPDNMSVYEYEGLLERHVKQLLATYRHDIAQLSTKWNESLEYALQPIVASYEDERLIGVPYGQVEYHLAIKQLVPLHHTISVVPVQYTLTASCMINIQVAAAGVMNSIIQNKNACDTLLCDTNGSTIGCRLRISPYAEQISSVWCVVAAISPAKHPHVHFSG